MEALEQLADVKQACERQAARAKDIGPALSAEVMEGLREAARDLSAIRVTPPETLEDWEQLARIVGEDPGPMTLGDIHGWALVWVEREKLRLRLAGKEKPAEPNPNQAGERGRAKKPRLATINQQMLDEFHRNPSSIEWSQREWAKRLGCMPSAVADTPAWKTIMKARAFAKAERLDREPRHRRH
jgi:hypothetical protein